MPLRLQLPRWEVLQNVESGECPVNKIYDKFCWQIIQELDSPLFDICSDCLVYLSERKDTFLNNPTKLDVEMHKKEDSPDSKTCQLLEIVMNRLQHHNAKMPHA